MIPEKKIKLAIVDDENSMLRVCKAAFDEMGYEVSLFADGFKFLESLAKGLIPDVILLDVMMPGKNGFEVCREMKNDAIYKKIKVILFTALSGGAVKHQSEECGADYYVTKGIEMEKISEIIKSLL